MRWMLKAATALALLAGPALADPGGKPHHHQEDGEDREEKGGQDLGQVVMTTAEQGLIRDYFHSNPQSVESDNLPPGLRKRLAQGKPLPPGIAKNLPDGLRHRLPPRDGYEYRVVGADVLLVEAATNVVVDILRDAMRQ